MAHPWEIMGSSDKENRRGAKSSDSEGGQQGFFFRFCNLELEDDLSSFKRCHGSNIGLARPSQGGYDCRLWTLFFTWLVDKWSKDQKVLGIRHTIWKFTPYAKVLVGDQVANVPKSTSDPPRSPDQLRTNLRTPIKFSSCSGPAG